ncbi:Ubiquinol-cytochrome c reductase iron-sulfur subunit [Candidatus Hodgkinia cicadicola]|nr:Ubiquinol-cytochrome c reductase iron-sulfur subunit [Candidatus Hodgkinia cicadicola]
MCDNCSRRGNNIVASGAAIFAQRLRVGQSENGNWFKSDSLRPARCASVFLVRDRLAREVGALAAVRVRKLQHKCARDVSISSNALAFDRNRRLDVRSENWSVALAPPSVTEHGWACACRGPSHDSSGSLASGLAPADLDVPKCPCAVNTLVLGLQRQLLRGFVPN